jgi:Fe2+ or Zn2+ uptake regulation protein
MISNEKPLRALLGERGIKPTYQRLAILAEVLDRRSHPAIKDLHSGLKTKVPTLSKTTLYSTLELFARHGLVRTLRIDPVEARYDGWTAPHHHFHCERCGAILDLNLACPTGRRGCIDGHEIREVHGYFRGVCRSCLAGAASSASPKRGAARAALVKHPSRRYQHA